MTETTTLRSRTEVEAQIANFIPALDYFVAAYHATHYKSLKGDTHTVERGPKFIRVVSNHSSSNPGRRVYCFLDWQGNIYKAESWKKPAKHVRGSIFDANFSLGKGLNIYGAIYLK